MSKFKQDGKKETPSINTSSLPDIVFMLLFFFMVTTVLRETEVMVKQSMPEATEIQKLERKNLVSYIYIGEPTDAKTYGTAPRIQLNDQYASKDDVGAYVIKEREARSEPERPLMTFSIKSDRDTKMGIVTDVKQELRRADALKINYSSVPRADDY
jgi:biopolymer transport protein ExbD